MPPQTAAYQSAPKADHFDDMAVKGPASSMIDVVPRLGYDFSAPNPNYNFLASQLCKGKHCSRRRLTTLRQR